VNGQAAVRTDSTEARPPFRSPVLLIAAIVLAILWWIVLVLLAVFTANPVTLNRDQIAHSSHVITGVVDDPSSGQVTVEREWKGKGLSGVITVEDLAASGARQGGKYLLPLSRGAINWRVSETPRPASTRLIYAESPDAIAQLQSILPR
jgi:hypothetical protein